MLRVLLIFVLLTFMPASIVLSAPIQNEEVENFIRHRNILLSVEFSSGSHMLTECACKSLDRIADDLKALLAAHKVVRIEGYANPTGDEGSNLVLSMQRAMTIQMYLQKRYGLDLDLYFIGFGSSKAPAGTVVQLAFYDDTLGLTVADVDKVITK